MRSSAVVAMVLAMAAGLAQTGTGHTLMRLAGLTSAPAAYTALYFTDPQSLPTGVRSGSFALTVPFTLHNLSATARTYQWSVSAVQGTRIRAAVRGRLTMAPDQAENLILPVSGFCRAGSRAGSLQVVIRLAAPQESIDFWAACGA
ncbi:MAG: hypothetical protein ACRDOU_28045 [Streptosporangiaceae bacterium]